MRQQDAVGGQGDIIYGIDAGQHPHQFRQSQPDQGFAAGNPHLIDAQLGGSFDYGIDFFIAENVVMGYQSNALGRHAVDAAQVAAVSYRDTQIIYRTLK